MEMFRIDTPPELDMPIGEAMFTQRAIRRLDRDRPIADAHLKVMLDAASKGPLAAETPNRHVFSSFGAGTRSGSSAVSTTKHGGRSAGTSTGGRARTTFPRVRCM